MKNTVIAICLGILIIFTSVSCSSNNNKSSTNKEKPVKETVLKVPDYIIKSKVKADSKVEFYGKFTPRAATEGERVVIELQIKNLGKKPINNLGVSFTNNFFKSLVVSRTAPLAKVKKFEDETTFYWGKLGPAEALTSNIIIYGNALGEFQSNVFLKDGDLLLKDEVGETLKKNAHINIYR